MVEKPEKENKCKTKIEVKGAQKILPRKESENL